MTVKTPWYIKLTTRFVKWRIKRHTKLLTEYVDMREMIRRTGWPV